MTETSINCPYCGAMNLRATINKGSTHKVSIKIYEYEHSSSKAIASTVMKCILCRREYSYIPMSDFSWIKSHLRLNDVALSALKISFPGQGLDAFFDNIIGVTRPKEMLGFSGKSLHVCFMINGTRAYVDCMQTNDNLLGITMVKV
jgi:hypothetical protein